MLAACLRVQGPAATDRAIMPPAFVVVFAGVMLFDLRVAMSIAAAAALTPGFVDAARVACAVAHRHRRRDLLPYRLPDSPTRRSRHCTPRLFLWPWLAVPIAAAVVAYHVVQAVVANVARAVRAAAGLNRSWPKRRCAGYPLLPARRRRRGGASSK